MPMAAETKSIEDDRTAPGGPDPSERYATVVEAFREVAEAITEDTDLDDLLHLVARKVCDLLQISRCSVFLNDSKTGLFRGQVAHSERDDNAAVKRLTAGIEADAFTHEIVAGKRPVLIANAQTDPRPVRSAMVDWGVTRILGVPMIGRDQQVIGILYLDNLAEPHEYSPDEQDLAASFANLAAVVIAQNRTASELRDTLRTVARQNSILRRTAAMDDQLASAALGGATLQDIANLIAGIVEKPCAIYDGEHSCLAVAQRADGDSMAPQLFEGSHPEHPDVAAALASVQPRGASVLGPFPAAGLFNRYLVAPVVVRDEHWGTLVVMEHGAPLTALDVAAAKRAATIIALEMSAERRVVDADAYARVSFVRDLIGGTDAAETLGRRAEAHRLDLSQPHVICVMRTSEGRELTAAEVESAGSMVEPDSGRCAAVVDADVVLLLELSSGGGRTPDVAEAGAVIRRIVAQLGRSDIRAAVSTACRRPDEIPFAFEEVRRAVPLVEQLVLSSGRSTVVTMAELGPTRLFLGSNDRAQALRFAQDALGPLVDAEGGDEGPLLGTLGIFLDSRSVRIAAKQLGVHENTVRYRLSRVHDIVGLDVISNPEQQLTAQVALMVLRFERGVLPDVGSEQALGDHSNGHTMEVSLDS